MILGINKPIIPIDITAEEGSKCNIKNDSEKLSNKVVEYFFTGPHMFPHILVPH